MRWLLSIPFLILSLSCAPSDRVVLWPHDAVRRSTNDFRIDGIKQLQALSNAIPESDASFAHFRGDKRLVSVRLRHPDFPGIADMQFILQRQDKTGFKFVACSDGQIYDTNFSSLASAYATRYNREIYRLHTNNTKPTK